MPIQVSCAAVEKYQVLVRTGRHSWLADEPPDVEGDGLGPNPFELLLSALGCCITITVVAYAAKAHIPLEKFYADVTGDNVQGKDKYQINVRLRARGDLNEQDLQRLEKAAHRCPVHKLLLPGSDIEMKLERV